MTTTTVFQVSVTMVCSPMDETMTCDIPVYPKEEAIKNAVMNMEKTFHNLIPKDNQCTVISGWRRGKTRTV